MQNTKHLSRLFKPNHSSEIIKISRHTTPSNEYYPVVVYRGRQYYVYIETDNGISRVLIKNIPEHFRNGVPYLVLLMTNSGDQQHCLICFHDIRAIPVIPLYCGQNPPYFPPMTFSVCVIGGKLMDIRFAKKNSGVSPNFGLGGFDMRLFIEKFRQASMFERRIPVLWNILVGSLRKIGYFDIYDYNDFQTTVLLLFQRMFFSREYHQNLTQRLFYSFVQRLLAKNSWFLIVGEFIQHIHPSLAFIDLFSDHRYPPTVNFIDLDSGVVGLTKQDGVGIDFRFVFNLVSLLTTQVRVVGSSNQSESCFECCPQSAAILSCLFPSCENNDSDDVDDSWPLLRRRPARPNTLCIKEGVLTIGCLRLFVFKIEIMIYVFVERSDGTFEPFNIYFFILSKMFADGDELYQLNNLFTIFSFVSVNHLIKGLLKCGLLPIFDGNLTNEQIGTFLLDSDFGQVLQELRQEFEGFQERLRCSMKNDHQLESIRENRFIMDFKRIFEFILQQLREQRDLEPEIVEIIDFLDQLVKFLTVSS